MGKDIKDYLDYDPETGVFTWKKTNSYRVKVGDVAGHKCLDGYTYIRFNNKLNFAHRLAFLFMESPIPDYVDHINGIRGDNRWCNLRPCNNSENLCNSKKRIDNTSGIKGISWYKSRNKWEVYINKDGKRKRLGYFDCIACAIRARKEAEEKYHGEFAYGKP